MKIERICLIKKVRREENKENKGFRLTKEEKNMRKDINNSL